MSSLKGSTLCATIDGAFKPRSTLFRRRTEKDCAADEKSRIIGRISFPKRAPAPEIHKAVSDVEAHRIADELMKLYQDGVISGPSDPEARFFAADSHVRCNLR